MRRVPIRLKLAIALAVPLLALGTLTAVEVLAAAAAVDEVRAQTELATATISPRRLLTELQNERAYVSLDLTGSAALAPEDRRGFEVTRAATDTAALALRDDLAGKGDTVRDAYGPAVAGLAALHQVRMQIDRFGGTRGILPEAMAAAADAFARYTAIITPFLDAATRLPSTIDDARMREGAELAGAAARQNETVALLVNGLTTAMSPPEGALDSVEELTAIAGLRSRFDRQMRELRSGTGIHAEIADRTVDDDLVDRMTALLDEAVATGRVDLSSAATGGAAGPFTAGFVAYQDAVGDAVSGRAADLNRAAEARQRWLVALALATLLAATVLTWLVSRSITRPLRSLTGQARDMARRHLPGAVAGVLQRPLGEDVDMPEIDHVAVTTRDEVADVADALNRVQVTALGLAVEQAVLRRNIADSFVNLGRRSQNLLRRQLDFITQLEAHEPDADALANLFRLDHLATRMRRNAESLLVLAGVAPARQWTVPLRISEVIRAALSEVEDFQRVAIRGVDPAAVLGSAAADLAHLLAELIENALVFSAREMSVDVTGRRRPTHYTITIRDAGRGMAPSEVAAANRRLAGAESFTVAPSTYLGHYVAGSLAARHGITIGLESGHGRGVTATVELPAGLLAGPGGVPGAAEARQGRDTGRTAGHAGDRRVSATWGAPNPSMRAASAPPTSSDDQTGRSGRS
ncbi:MAG TPA: ATP-binding protein [Acidimicrobiales bacterium]|nr:ATP-binding protein [Acidimicrobiales bacterium]